MTLLSPGLGPLPLLRQLHRTRSLHSTAKSAVASGRGCVDTSAMPGYGQFCPIAQAAEVLTERWTPLVIRELALTGSCRFNDIQRGVPLMSSSLLSKRGGHQRDPALDVVEPAAARERQLADHKRRPALGEHFRRLGDGTEL